MNVTVIVVTSVLYAAGGKYSHVLNINTHFPLWNIISIDIILNINKSSRLMRGMAQTEQTPEKPFCCVRTMSHATRQTVLHIQHDEVCLENCLLLQRILMLGQTSVHFWCANRWFNSFFFFFFFWKGLPAARLITPKPLNRALIVLSRPWF